MGDALASYCNTFKSILTMLIHKKKKGRANNRGSHTTGSQGVPRERVFFFFFVEGVICHTL